MEKWGRERQVEKDTLRQRETRTNKIKSKWKKRINITSAHIHLHTITTNKKASVDMKNEIAGF